MWSMPYVERDKHAGVLIIDFSKVYNKVVHQHIFMKFEQYSTRG